LAGSRPRAFAYNDTRSWVGGNINNLFDTSLTLTGPLQITIPQTYTTTGNLNFNYAQGQAGNDITMAGAGATPAVLTLGGNLSYNPNAGPGRRGSETDAGREPDGGICSTAARTHRRPCRSTGPCPQRVPRRRQPDGDRRRAVYLSGASTYTGPTQIAGFVDLGADALPNVPGPFGNASSAVQLNLAALPGAGNVVTLNLQPGITIGARPGGRRRHADQLRGGDLRDRYDHDAVQPQHQCGGGRNYVFLRRRLQAGRCVSPGSI